MTTYHFNGNDYTLFADLANAYLAARGYFPIGAYEECLNESGWHLYYR